MAAGTFTVLNRAKTKLVDGTFDLDTHTWKAALVTSSWTPTADYAGTSTDARYADIGAAEVANGNGYTTGGATLTGVSLTRATTTVKFTSTAPTWASATFTAKYMVIYSNTDTAKGILGYIDLETTVGAGLSPVAGSLTVNPDGTNGWFTLA